MRRHRLVLLLCSATPWFVTTAHAEPPAANAPEGATVSPALNGTDDDTAPKQQGAPAPGPYKGVVPGGDQLPPHPPRLPVKGPVRVTWPGFQVRDGVPTVFLQLTGPVEWTVAEAPDKLVYTLRAATIPLANNRRPLRVAEFQTAVKEVEAKRRGRDVELTIRVRQKVAHHERTEGGAGGFKFLVIELPSS